MATKLIAGDKVWVPYRCLDKQLTGNRVVFLSKILGIQKRKVIIQHPTTDAEPVTVANSLVHKRIGIAIIRIGDQASELTLLDPLAKSLLHFFRLLLSDDLVRLLKVRSLQELGKIWSSTKDMVSHVVLVGHGESKGVSFLMDGVVSAQKLAGQLKSTDGYPRQFISLCCKTGRKPFASDFSAESGVDSLVAPYHSIHGGLASQFCQAYYIHHLLGGRTSATAYDYAAKSVPTGINFTLWKKGRKEKGAA